MFNAIHLEVIRLDRGIRIVFGISFILALSLTIASPPAVAGGGQSERGYVTYTTAENYSPSDFDLSMDNGGSMSRGWNSFTYTVTRSNPTTRTRRVVDHYTTNKIYGTRKVFTGNYKQVYVGTKKVVDHRELRFRKVTYQDWVPGHYETRHRWTMKPIKVWGVTVGYRPARESYQKWIPGHYETKTKTQSYWKPIYKTVKVYKKKPIYRTERYVKRVERKPVYTKERYTVYQNRKYRVTDYRVEDWGSKQIPITLAGKNGYEGDVTISVQTEDGINASLADTTLHVASTASTTLTVSPSSSVSDSTRSFTVTATDGSTTKTKTYSLRLETESKPSRKVERIKSWTSGTRPDETGQTTVVVNNRPDETVPVKTEYKDVDQDVDLRPVEPGVHVIEHDRYTALFPGGFATFSDWSRDPYLTKDEVDMLRPGGSNNVSEIVEDFSDCVPGSGSLENIGSLPSV